MSDIEILLVSHQYPNLNGDYPFISPEIPFLLDKFCKVHVLCLENKDMKSEKISESIENYFYDCSFRYFRVKSLFYFIKSFFSPLFYQELKEIMLNRKTIQCVFRSLLYTAHVHELYPVINKILHQNKSIKIVYTYWNGFETVASLLQKKEFPVKVISRAHGYDLYQDRNSLNYQPYKKFIAKYIDHLFFISKNGMDYFTSFWGDKRNSKFSVSYLGCRGTLYKQNESKEDHLTIISCSYIIPVKRVHKIILTLSQINSVKIKWIHIGTGDLYSEILTLAEQYLSDLPNISYEFMGSLTYPQVRAYYNEHFIDLFVNVSESEGVPVSIMEAMATGIPVIATDVGGTAEIVNSDNGFLIPKDFTEEQLKEIIIRFNNLSFVERAKLRENAYLTWNEKFNSEKNYQKFVSDVFDMV